MSALEVRKFQGNFSGVDSLWNPDHPSFAIAMNKFSFWAIGFEKYTCDVMCCAQKLIEDAAILVEAQVFRAQKSAHSLAHRKHVRALIERYDNLYASRDLKYHLAYIGGLESTFTPSMKLLIDNREDLMAKGDAREEIKHHASEITIYDEFLGITCFKLSLSKDFLNTSCRYSI
jgi:hypothetical protein